MHEAEVSSLPTSPSPNPEPAVEPKPKPRPVSKPKSAKASKKDKPAKSADRSKSKKAAAGKKATEKKAAAKKASTSEPVKQPAKRGPEPKLLPKGQHQPTRNGEAFYSGWKSRVHGRMQSAKDSTVLCQRTSRSEIWTRDLVTVPPGHEKEITCKRCLLAVGKQRRAGK